jgi:hypothetical protein
MPGDTGALFRHCGFAGEYAESGLGHTAQTCALILQGLAGYLAGGSPPSFFTCAVPKLGHWL